MKGSNVNNPVLHKLIFLTTKKKSYNIQKYMYIIITFLKDMKGI